MREVRLEHDYKLAEQERMLQENESLANSKLTQEKDGSYYKYSGDISQQYSNDGRYYEDYPQNNSMRNPYSPENEDKNSSSDSFTFSPRKKRAFGQFRDGSERASGEFYGGVSGGVGRSDVGNNKNSSNGNTGDSGGNLDSQGNTNKGTKSPQEIRHMIMSDREVMLSNVREKLNAYVGKSGSKYSVINAAKRNIDTRNEYIDYMHKEGLSGADILEGDNNKDEQLLQDLDKNGRTYFLEYSY